MAGIAATAKEAAREIERLIGDIIHSWDGVPATVQHPVTKEGGGFSLVYNTYHKVWVFTYWSTEFSSSYSAMGVSRSPGLAITAATDDPDVHAGWKREYPGLLED